MITLVEPRGGSAAAARAAGVLNTPDLDLLQMDLWWFGLPQALQMCPFHGLGCVQNHPIWPFLPQLKHRTPAADFCCSIGLLCTARIFFLYVDTAATAGSLGRFALILDDSIPSASCTISFSDGIFFMNL